jgi:hypothetical protein
VAHAGRGRRGRRHRHARRRHWRPTGSRTSRAGCSWGSPCSPPWRRIGPRRNDRRAAGTDRKHRVTGRPAEEEGLRGEPSLRCRRGGSAPDRRRPPTTSSARWR